MLPGVLRLAIYDRTCRGRGPLPGLSHAWQTGSALYRASGCIDASRGVTSWREALDWVARVEPHDPIAEVQFWGHGKWGRALIGNEALDRDALGARHPLARSLAAVRERLSPAGALVWFRTCETLGASAGQDFARAFSEALDCTVAGHTYVIGFWQSGLHALAPGATPAWSPAEGLREGTPDHPIAAAWSMPGEPCTITCLVPRLPACALDADGPSQPADRPALDQRGQRA